MKTILIPTDYHPSSFDCIPALSHYLKNEEMNLIFVHMFKLSDSISELLMLSRRSREYEKVSDGFYLRLNEIKEAYPQVASVKIEFLYGSTLSMFKNFLEDNEVDAVLDTESCSFSALHKSSINPNVLVKKCGLPVISADKTFEKVKLAPDAAGTVYRQEELLTEV